METRSQVVEALMQLSDAGAAVERARAATIANEQSLAGLTEAMNNWKRLGPDPKQRLVETIGPEMAPVRVALLDVLSQLKEEVPPSLLSAGDAMTGAQLVQLAQLCSDRLSLNTSFRATREKDLEKRLRDILQRVADATDDGE